MNAVWIAAVLLLADGSDAPVGPAWWLSKDDIPQLQAIAAQGEEAVLWERIRQRAVEFCAPDANGGLPIG